MITFNYEIDFNLENEKQISNWIGTVIKAENHTLGDINYIFCNDDFLLKMNMDYLNHDTLTDIISFDYSEGKILRGDIFISIDRVKENAQIFKVGFLEELHRVMIHGVLHYCGYMDKSRKEASIMRKKEDFYLEQVDINS